MQQLILNGIELKDLLDEVRKIVKEEISSQPPPPVPESETQYFTRKQVAKRLNISLVTLSDWQKKKIIGYNRINSRIYFTQANIDEALKKTKSSAKP